MALKVLPPESPEDAEKRARLVEALRPLAERVAARDLSLISIGGQCVTSGLLQTFGLRLTSYPFDWLFSSLRMIEHCLRDDFSEFLNPAQYEPVPVEARGKPTVHRTHHRLYRDEFGVEHVFNHHDMPEKLPHFERTVRRFQRAPNRRLVHIARHRPADFVEQVAAVAQATDGKVLAVSVAPEPTAVAPEIRHFASGDDYDIYEMSTEAPLKALGFGSAQDEEAFGRLLLDHFHPA